MGYVKVPLSMEPGDLFCDTLAFAFRALPSDKRVKVVEPGFRNSRVFAQKGLFVVPTNLDGKAIYEMFDRNSTIITIPDAIREEARSYLSRIGFDEFHLMPDLGSVCTDINNRASTIVPTNPPEPTVMPFPIY